VSLNPPPLPPFQPTWGQFQAWWQQFLEQLKAVLAAIETELGALEEAQAAMQAALDAQAAADAAQTTADSAQTDANTANTTANTVKRNDAITASYPAPGDVITVTDAGSSVTVSIDAHSRVYGDISNKSVNGGTVTGQPYNTALYIYYDDINRAGGSVTYHATSNPNVALPTKAAGRHFVGEAPALAAGDPPATGGTAPPSGGGTIDKGDVHSTL
jgi:hypothetical protein